MTVSSSLRTTLDGDLLQAGQVAAPVSVADVFTQTKAVEYEQIARGKTEKYLNDKFEIWATQCLQLMIYDITMKPFKFNTNSSEQT